MREEREVLELLDELFVLRQAIRETQKREREITEVIKQYLLDRGEDELVDGEKGVRARLVTRRGPDTYDVRNMPDELVLRLKELAALSVDTKVTKALEGKVIEALDIKRFRIPGSETQMLVIEEVKQ